VSVDLNALQTRYVWVDVTATELCEKVEQLMAYAVTAPEAALPNLDRGLMAVFELVTERLEYGVAMLDCLGKELGVALAGNPEWVDAREAAARERAELTLEEMRENIDDWSRDLENYQNCLPNRAYHILDSDNPTPADLQLLQKIHAAMSEAVDALARDRDVFDVWAEDQDDQWEADD
jgi:hypothetical protein